MWNLQLETSLSHWAKISPLSFNNSRLINSRGFCVNAEDIEHQSR